MYLETKIKKLSVANKKKLLKGLPVKICFGESGSILLTKTQQKNLLSKSSMELSCSEAHCKKLHNFYNKNLLGGGVVGYGSIQGRKIAPEPVPQPMSEEEKKQDDYENIDVLTKLKKVKKKNMKSVKMGKRMKELIEAESDYRVEEIMEDANRDLIYEKNKADYNKRLSIKKK